MSFNSEFNSVYKYSSPPVMPGIRRLNGVPEERHRVPGFPSQFYSFPASQRIVVRRPMLDNSPVTTVDPSVCRGIPMNEGFGFQNNNQMFWTIVIIALIIAFFMYNNQIKL